MNEENNRNINSTNLSKRNLAVRQSTGTEKNPSVWGEWISTVITWWGNCCNLFLQTLEIMQWVYQEEKVELLEKYLTWFTPLVSSIAAIIFAAEEEIDEEASRGRKSFSFLCHQLLWGLLQTQCSGFSKNNDGLMWKLPIGFLLSGCFMSPL